MTIERLIFLIHPGCYEVLPADSPLWRANLDLYASREREVKGRWLDEVSRRGRETLVLQLYGPDSLFDEVVRRLGPANACYVRADWASIADRPNPLPTYYDMLTACIREHLDRHRLTLDPASVTSEIWGESFEGCATNYSSAFAERLGLRRKPSMRFDMTVYDSRFLAHAKGPEVIALAGTDIEAMLFELYDGTTAAMFQGRLHAQYTDTRTIHLRLDPARVQVTLTSGFTIWPEKPPVRAMPEEPRPYEYPLAYPAPWVRGVAMKLDELRDVVTSGVVHEPSHESARELSASGARP
jgi:hypothetical protein